MNQAFYVSTTIPTATVSAANNEAAVLTALAKRNDGYNIATNKYHEVRDLFLFSFRLPGEIKSHGTNYKGYPLIRNFHRPIADIVDIDMVNPAAANPETREEFVLNTAWGKTNNNGILGARVLKLVLTNDRRSVMLIVAPDTNAPAFAADSILRFTAVCLNFSEINGSLPKET